MAPSLRGRRKVQEERKKGLESSGMETSPFAYLAAPVGTSWGSGGLHRSPVEASRSRVYASARRSWRCCSAAFSTRSAPCTSVMLVASRRLRRGCDGGRGCGVISDDASDDDEPEGAFHGVGGVVQHAAGSGGQCGQSELVHDRDPLETQERKRAESTKSGAAVRGRRPRSSLRSGVSPDPAWDVGRNVFRPTSIRAGLRSSRARIRAGSGDEGRGCLHRG